MKRIGRQILTICLSIGQWKNPGNLTLIQYRFQKFEK